MICPTYSGELNKNSQYKGRFFCKQTTHLKWCLTYALNTKLFLRLKALCGLQLLSKGYTVAHKTLYLEVTTTFK